MIFRIPHTIWKIFEKGHIKSFYSEEAKSASILTNDDLRNELLNRNSNLFNRLKGSLKWYHIKFVVGQLLNFLLVPIMFFINDLFLNGKFSQYGIDSIPNGNEQMCLTFPTQVIFDEDNCLMTAWWLPDDCLITIALLVVNFSKEGYKIRKFFT